MGSPNALKIDAMSLIFAATVNDEELSDSILDRHADDPTRIVKAVAHVGALLTNGDTKNKKAVVDWVEHLAGKLEDRPATSPKAKAA